MRRAHRDDSFRQGRCSRCAAVFHVCRRCDRGQQYCGKACGDDARRAAVRAAGHRHQASAAGKRDHAARQAAYRARKKVTHQGIRDVDVGCRVAVPTDRTAAMLACVSMGATSAPDDETTPHLQALTGADAPLPGVGGDRDASGCCRAAWMVGSRSGWLMATEVLAGSRASELMATTDLAGSRARA